MLEYKFLKRLTVFLLPDREGEVEYFRSGLSDTLPSEELTSTILLISVVKWAIIHPPQ